MTAARTSYRQRQQISELSFSMAMTRARVQNAEDAAKRRRLATAAKLAALEPLLARAGYGPHGDADWIRAQARAVRAASSARRSGGTGGTEHTGPGCRICRSYGAGSYPPGAVITTGYREIRRDDYGRAIR
jgi:hypothetical protein